VYAGLQTDELAPAQSRKKFATSILIVDDDKALLRLMALILSTEALPVQVASCAEDALRSLDESPPDLIVLDMNMPEIDGRAFHNLARAHGYEGPVIVCSAYGAGVAQQEIGADGALPKPFDPELLVGMIRRLLDN
jgi:DNA-binding response OmpR family regulator